MLITFEGIDGSGKSTQTRLLYEYLLPKVDSQIIITSEPYSTAARSLLDQNEFYSIDSSVARSFVYFADRAIHIEELINPALKSGHIVICDRYIDSSIAYQSVISGLSVGFIYECNSVCSYGIVPNLTLLLDTPTDVACARKMHDGEVMNEDTELTLCKIRSSYLAIAQKEPDRIKIIDSNQSRYDVHDEIVMFVDRALDIDICIRCRSRRQVDRTKHCFHCRA